MTPLANADSLVRRQPPARVWLPALSGLLCAVFANTSVAGEISGSPQQSLDRMARAAQELNYDGTFVYRNGATIQSMRIIHRGGGEGERERLVALSGAAREVIRDRERVTCILPDSQTVVVAKSRPRTFPYSKLFASGAGFSRFYVLSTERGERVAGRHTQLVIVDPHDGFRYGYRLWMDRDLGLLLKSELIDEQGEIVEQLVYTNIDLPASIPDELLEPAISGAGYTWYNDDRSEPVTASAADSEPGWYPGWLPDGFELSDVARDPILASRDPVEHLAGLDAMGAVNAYGRMIEDYQITVVGEVPATTVERICRSIVRR